MDILLALTSALVAGSLIGLERTYHGRPAGFRTHALVCLASALLMVVAVYQLQWFRDATHDIIRIDPTRMAQGIMTGIGFLGAGVIFKEGLTVRGLTTAASIWITATLGILYGIGFYLPAIYGTLATLGVLALFRWFERLMPTQYFFRFRIRYAKEDVPDLTVLLSFLKEHGFTASALSYTLVPGGAEFEYETVIRSSRRKSGQLLTIALLQQSQVREFSVSPSGD
ncbi:MAG: MgtC/SapB family protein [Rhodospirillaceae bacterium]|jgi:putative Mg2+ transporter-C (MgtC) family protein|nr:MgtC/SapB family protein [Rhodospirillaceae bacterium]MBT5456229.1 MgtC/SapB family protein [Rhodospirillaceae bacterium]